jgi:hypothetical protein
MGPDLVVALNAVLVGCEVVALSCRATAAPTWARSRPR